MFDVFRSAAALWRLHDYNSISEFVFCIELKVKCGFTELGKTHMKLQDSEVQAQKSLEEKESLDYQLKLLKDKIQEIAKLEQHYRTEKQSIITENSALREANHYLEDR